MAETRKDLPRMMNVGGIRMALNVRSQGLRPELVLGLLILSNLCIEWGVMAVITHLLDGHHMKNSLHYAGAGADFVVELGDRRSEFVDDLRDRLGRDYDVVDEGTHIHVEYQPHIGAVT